MTGEEIREMIRNDFGVDLPIGGGSGTRLHDALTIHRTEGSNAAAIEHAYLKHIGLGRGIVWQVMEQALVYHEDRRIDRVTIMALWYEGERLVRQEETYYFDVTAFFPDHG